MIQLASCLKKYCSRPGEEHRSYTVYLLYSLSHTITVYCTAVLVESLNLLLCNQQRWRSDVKCLAKARMCCLCKPNNASHVMVIYEGQIVNAVSNCIQNLFCNTNTLLEQPLLLYIIVTGVEWMWYLCVFCVHRELVHIYNVCYVCKTLTLPSCTFSQLIVM